MKILISIGFLLVVVAAQAQILNKIKNRAEGKARAEAGNARYNAQNKAKDAGRKELDDFKAGFDSTDTDYAILLSDNSGLFGGRGKGETGAKFLRMAGILSSLYKDADLTDEENARLNLQVGQSAYASGRFIFAEKRLKSAQQYFEKAYLTEDLGYLKTISGQGLLYTTMGRFAQAEKFTADALQLRETKLGKTDMSVAASLNNYAVLHYNTGQYNEAEKKFAEALTVMEANQHQTNMAYAIALNNQAILYQAMGRYDAAEKNLRQAISITGKLEVTKSRNHLKFFSNLALLFQQTGKYEEAERIYRELENRIEKGKSEHANLLNNAAILGIVTNRDLRVEDMLRRAADIYKTNIGENSPAYAKVISDLGNFFRYKGRYDEAKPLLEQALQIREQTLDSKHPLYVQSQEDLAILYWKMKNFDKAFLLYHDVMDKSLDFINRFFGPMSEAEKTKYWDILSPRFQRFYNFALDAGNINKDILTDLFAYRVATKGLLLNSTRKVSESITGSGNDELIRNYSVWLDLKEQLTRLYVYSKEELKEENVNIDSLEDAANTMEKRLSEQSKEFSSFYFTEKITYNEIQQHLQADEALIEIIRVRHFDQVFTDSSVYIGLVAMKNTTAPKLVVLTNGPALEKKLAKAYRQAMKNRIPDEQSWTHYWSAFETEVKAKKKIYVSLDGVYNQVNLYTLKKPGGNFLINQYDIVLLGNARDVLTHSAAGPLPQKKATLIGYPDYGSDKIPELPATKAEVDGINAVLKSSGYDVAEFTRQDATEANLKQAKKMTVLHIATHGYFFQDVQKASWPIGVHADNAKENVLLRSGLMLTGASDANEQSPDLINISNGIITSYEAMNLDLNGTSLVVLSACETGLGEVKAGEGVYGLQRAFLVAGAQTVVMSLWKVDDAATQQLMNNFYSNWIKTGDRQQAFKQAQLQLMTKYKEPYYWGAFVMMED